MQRIVERHGGKVEAHAEAGRGASFEFTLPCPAEPQPSALTLPRNAVEAVA